MICLDHRRCRWSVACKSVSRAETSNSSLSVCLSCLTSKEDKSSPSVCQSKSSAEQYRRCTGCSSTAAVGVQLAAETVSVWAKSDSAVTVFSDASHCDTACQHAVSGCNQHKRVLAPVTPRVSTQSAGAHTCFFQCFGVPTTFGQLCGRD